LGRIGPRILVFGVGSQFRCDAEHRTRKASHRLGEFGL
jgi:hypothetical protein